MRSALIAFLLLIGLPAQAAVVDFEEIPSSAENNVGFVSSGGFTFTGSDIFLVLDNSDQTHSDGHYIWGFTIPGDTTLLTISRDDGLAFDLHSLGLLGTGSEFTISGYNASDQLIATTEILPTDWETSGWETFGFDGAWDDVSKVVIEDSIFSFGALMPTTAGIRLDNFSATVVPIPAAVWLFGSALAGLMGFRRIRTA